MVVYAPEITVLRQLRQNNFQIKASLGYTVGPCLGTQSTQKRKQCKGDAGSRGVTRFAAIFTNFLISQHTAHSDEEMKPDLSTWASRFSGFFFFFVSMGRKILTSVVLLGWSWNAQSTSQSPGPHWAIIQPLKAVHPDVWKCLLANLYEPQINTDPVIP